MNHTDHVREGIDLLDTRIPDPDLAALRSGGSGIRRRRRTLQTVGAAAAVAVLAVPLLTFLGGNAPATDGPPVAGAPAAPLPAPAAFTDSGFGDGMAAAVAAAFPGAAQTDEELGDRWMWRDHTNLDHAVGSPPRWATLFAWNQYYDVAGVDLSVIARRESPSPVIDPASYGYCRDGLFVVEQACRTWEVDGRTVVLHDGTQARGQQPDVWLRTVDVYGAEGTESMVALTSVSVVGVGDTWVEAQGRMPAVDDLAALALDPRLILPEPDRYPREFPADRPRG